MKRHTLATRAAPLALAILLSACGGGGGGSAPSPAPPAPPPPPASTQTNFTVFMRGQTTTTASEDGQPVDIETIDWVFTDDDNETVYDDILQPST